MEFPCVFVSPRVTLKSPGCLLRMGLAGTTCSWGSQGVQELLAHPQQVRSPSTGMEEAAGDQEEDVGSHTSGAPQGLSRVGDVVGALGNPANSNILFCGDLAGEDEPA